MRQRWANYKAKTGMQMFWRSPLAKFSYLFFSTASAELEERADAFSPPFISSYIGSSIQVSIIHCTDSLNAAETHGSWCEPKPAPLLKLVFYHNQVKAPNQTCTLLSGRTPCTKETWPARCSPLCHHIGFNDRLSLSPNPTSPAALGAQEASGTQRAWQTW